MEEIIKSLVQKHGYSALKAEQLKVVSQFVSGKDVFAVLPTGYGKNSALTALTLNVMKFSLGSPRNLFR